jgi:hypothetical protein
MSICLCMPPTTTALEILAQRTTQAREMPTIQLFGQNHKDGPAKKLTGPPREPKARYCLVILA